MPELTIPVPVSLIERVENELAYRVRTAVAMWQAKDRDGGDRTAAIEAEVRGGRTAVRALLSQPTPTAVPVLPVRAVVAVLEHYDNGEGECEPEDRWRLFRDMRSLLASKQVIGATPAAPPSIADMAPGTTFTAETAGVSVRWRKEPDGWVSRIINGGRSVYPQPPLDPSMIRDVRPPA